MRHFHGRLTILLAMICLISLDCKATRPEDPDLTSCISRIQVALEVTSHNLLPEEIQHIALVVDKQFECQWIPRKHQFQNPLLQEYFSGVRCVELPQEEIEIANLMYNYFQQFNLGTEWGGQDESAQIDILRPLKMAARLYHAPAIVALACKLENDPNLAETAILLTHYAAVQGYAEALYYLATQLETILSTDATYIKLPILSPEISDVSHLVELLMEEADRLGHMQAKIELCLAYIDGSYNRSVDPSSCLVKLIQLEADHPHSVAVREAVKCMKKHLTTMDFLNGFKKLYQLKLDYPKSIRIQKAFKVMRKHLPRMLLVRKGINVTQKHHRKSPGLIGVKVTSRKFAGVRHKPKKGSY